MKYAAKGIALFAFLVFVSDSEAANPLFFKSKRCLATLANLGEFSPGIVEKQETTEAIEALAHFRADVLEGNAVAGGTGAVNVSNQRMNSGKRDKLIARIRGLEIDFYNPRTEDHFTRGKVFKGRKQIEEYLTSYQANDAMLSPGYRRGVKMFSIPVFGMTVVTGTLTMHALTGEMGSIPFSLIGGSTILVPTALGMFKAFGKSVGREGLSPQLTQESLAKLQSNQWDYRSFNHWVDKDLLDLTLLGRKDLVGIYANKLAPIELLIGGTREKVFSQVDTFFVTDEEGEPSLMVFVRGSKDKPRYPQRQKEQKKRWSFSFGWQGTKVPLPAPASE